MQVVNGRLKRLGDTGEDLGGQMTVQELIQEIRNAVIALKRFHEGGAR